MPVTLLAKSTKHYPWFGYKNFQEPRKVAQIPCFDKEDHAENIYYYQEQKFVTRVVRSFGFNPRSAIGAVSLAQSLWRGANVLVKWQLAILPRFVRREFIPRMTHDNFLVPLWDIFVSLCQNITIKQQTCIYIISILHRSSLSIVFNTFQQSLLMFNRLIFLSQ